jgi:cation diffusion facilitator family transporter
MAKTEKVQGGRSSVAASGLISGGIAALLALFMAVTANSIALWADWVATVLDLTAVAIAWWGLRRSESGKDDDYNYGFGRLESLAGIGMAGLMVLSFLIIIGAAFIRFQHPVPVSGMGVWVGIGLHLIFGFINGRLTLLSLAMERREKSALATAQRRVFTIKAAANVLMFSSLCISFFGRGRLWTAYADPVAATLIACSLLAGASKTFKFSAMDLLDRALEEHSKLLIIRALTLHFDRYEQIHEIRTRSAGNRIYVEIFLEFSGSRTHREVMDTIRSLQKEIKSAVKCDEVLIIPT